MSNLSDLIINSPFFDKETEEFQNGDEYSQEGSNKITIRCVRKAEYGIRIIFKEFIAHEDRGLLEMIVSEGSFFPPGTWNMLDERGGTEPNKADTNVIFPVTGGEMKYEMFIKYTYSICEGENLLSESVLSMWLKDAGLPISVKEKRRSKKSNWHVDSAAIILDLMGKLSSISLYKPICWVFGVPVLKDSSSFSWHLNYRVYCPGYDGCYVELVCASHYRSRNNMMLSDEGQDEGQICINDILRDYIQSFRFAVKGQDITNLDFSRPLSIVIPCDEMSIEAQIDCMLRVRQSLEPFKQLFINDAIGRDKIAKSVQAAKEKNNGGRVLK